MHPIGSRGANVTCMKKGVVPGKMWPSQCPATREPQVKNRDKQSEVKCLQACATSSICRLLRAFRLCQLEGGEVGGCMWCAGARVELAMACSYHVSC